MTNIYIIVRDYRPGYRYGTIKTYKQNYALHPIISQIPTPVYQLTKIINQLITPYIPSKYSIKSTLEVIKILKKEEP